MVPRSELSARAFLNCADSSIVRRGHITVSAAMTPTTKAIRHPQDPICCSVRNCCRISYSPRVSSWPPVRVTYWNEE